MVSNCNSPGLSINPFEDTITPQYVKSLIQLGAKFLRYPEGEISQNIYWATAPTWQPTSQRFINKSVWPATEEEYRKPDGTPKMFNLKSFLSLCSRVKATPIILVPMNSMFGTDKTPYADISKNAQELVKYIGARDVIYELGNETTLGKSPNGNTNIIEYTRVVRKLFADMKKVNPKVKCLVNGETMNEWAYVASIPGILGVVVHNYPGSDVATWLKQDGAYLAKKVADCKLAIGNKDVFITETNPTNFTEQPNNIGFSMMNVDTLLQSMLHAPKCSIVWTTKWSHALTNPTSLYSMLDTKDKLTCLAHMVKLLSFAMAQVASRVNGKLIYTNVSLKKNKSVFTFSNTMTKKTVTVIIHKKTVPYTIAVPKGKVWYSLFGKLEDTAPQYKTSVSTGSVVFAPMSMNVIV